MEERNYKTWRGQAADSSDGSVTPGLIFGLAIVAIGVLFLLDNFGVDVGVVWGYWPIILIAVGLSKLVDTSNTAGRTSGAIVLLVGIVFLAHRIHLPFLNDISLWNLWPLALTAFGVMMLVGALDGKSGANMLGGLSGLGSRGGFSAKLNLFAVFGGGSRNLAGDFKGGDALALFGGYEIKLRNATMAEDEVVLNVNAIFGGFEIKVPDTWAVSMQVTGIFGGHEDKTHQPDLRLVPHPKRLVIRGATIFGGLSVKN